MNQTRSGALSLTVVMPLHDAGPWVAAAIESVLHRADRLLELIVIDDGSTDDGARIATAYGDPVRVIAQANRGPAAARNTGITEACGDLVGFLDADDIWSAGSPDRRIGLIEAGIADIAVGLVQPVTGDLRPWGDPKPGVLAGSVVARRSVFVEYGMLDEDRLHGEDVDWMQRMREAGVPTARVDAVTGLYRRREGSLTRRREDNRRAVAELIHDSLKRRGVI